MTIQAVITIHCVLLIFIFLFFVVAGRDLPLRRLKGKKIGLQLSTANLSQKVVIAALFF